MKASMQVSVEGDLLCHIAQKAAGQAYADRQFGETLILMDELVKEEPEAARFHEMRAQVLRPS